MKTQTKQTKTNKQNVGSNNPESGLKNRSEQLSGTETQTAKTSERAETVTVTQDASVKPYVNFAEREFNRTLSVEKVLEKPQRWMAEQFKLAEVVGKWIWITFTLPIRFTRKDPPPTLTPHSTFNRDIMSRAKNQFDESIKDAEQLLAYFDAAKPRRGGPPPPNAEVLKRAGLILAITAWETYVEDRAREALEANLTPVSGSRASQFMKSKFDEEIRRFHNPNTEKTSKLFTDYTGKDITKLWNCNPGGAAKAKELLDKWVNRRGQAAHRSPPNGTGQPSLAHLITREDLVKLIKFLKILVTQTEASFP